jgi:hypothetical protein
MAWPERRAAKDMVRLVGCVGLLNSLGSEIVRGERSGK